MSQTTGRGRERGEAPRPGRVYPHGTNRRYVHNGCRCQACRDGAYRYNKQRHIRRHRGEVLTVEAEPYRDMLRGLMALGWSGPELGRRVGWTSGESIARLFQTNHRMMLAATAVRIAAVYEDLRDMPGPSPWTRARAAKAGWPIPKRREWSFDELDEIAVERACYGDAVPLTRAERDEAVRRLSAVELPILEIARRLRMHPRQVIRIRTREVA